MTKRRWLTTAISEAAKPQGPAVFSRQVRQDRRKTAVKDKPIRAA